MRIMRYRLKVPVEILWAGEGKPDAARIVRMLREEMSVMEIDYDEEELTEPYLPSHWYGDTPIYGLFDEDEDMPITAGEALKQRGLL